MLYFNLKIVVNTITKITQNIVVAISHILVSKTLDKLYNYILKN